MWTRPSSSTGRLSNLTPGLPTPTSATSWVLKRAGWMSPRRVPEGNRARPQGCPAHTNLGIVTGRRAIRTRPSSSTGRLSNLTPSPRWRTLTSATPLKARRPGSGHRRVQTGYFGPDSARKHFGLASALSGAKQWDRSASVYAAALKRFGADVSPGPSYKAIHSEEVFTRLTAQQPDGAFRGSCGLASVCSSANWKRPRPDYAHLYGSLGGIDPAKVFPEGSDDLFSFGCVL